MRACVLVCACVHACVGRVATWGCFRVRACLCVRACVRAYVLVRRMAECLRVRASLRVRACVLVCLYLRARGCSGDTHAAALPAPFR